MQDLREWYKIPALARKWQDKGITEDDIEHMIEIGKLNAVLRDSGYHLPLSVDSLKEHERALCLRGCNNFTTVFCDISFDGDEEMGLELVVMPEEVERAEAEHFTPTVKNIIAAETTVAPDKFTKKPEAYAASTVQEITTAETTAAPDKSTEKPEVYAAPTVQESTTAETTVAPGKLTEKPEAYAARRRFEGASDKDIARELREAACHYSTIGRTLKPLPEVANSAYGKRGKKLVHG